MYAAVVGKHVVAVAAGQLPPFAVGLAVAVAVELAAAVVVDVVAARQLWWQLSIAAVAAAVFDSNPRYL